VPCVTVAVYKESLMKKYLYPIIFSIIIVLSIVAIFMQTSPSIKLYPLIKSNINKTIISPETIISPVIGIEKIEDDKILIISLDTFVEHKGEKIRIHLRNGKISYVRIDLDRKNAEVIWNYSLNGYRIFSYPHVKNGSIIVAVVDSRTFNKSEILKISDQKVGKIATVKFQVLRINSFEDGKILLTGSRDKCGKVVLLENSSKILDVDLGNRTMDSLILDVNGDGYKDFLVSGSIFSEGFVSVFLNTFSGFREVKRIKIPNDIVWDIRFANLGKEKIVLFGPKGIYLLNLQNYNVETLFKSEDNYYLSQIEVTDLDHDGFDEFFCVYHNETQCYFIELEYSSGKLYPILKYPINLEGCFALKHIKNNNFIVSSPYGDLYLMKLV